MRSCLSDEKVVSWIEVVVRSSTLMFLANICLLLGNSMGINAAQSVRCDSDCVQTVRTLIQLRKHGASITWIEKDNPLMGDSVAIGLARIYRGAELLRIRNFRWYLPLLTTAFVSLEIIAEPANKEPTYTLDLLNRLLRRTRDSYWRLEIQKAINSVRVSTGNLGVVDPVSVVRQTP
ncbi:MAG: hypothetical protein ABIP75_05945 [Pyrinomonadaceae bacterium]